ncbi:acyl-CoA dehydrogenase family protein [Aquipuribacter sp. MA13-6]|uniref:acyl-CoA dehydrogenase family protein n=1 Tax=unclassified Aquipuribacter TaxID=2635084 RepID=UPI003EEDE29D
MSGTTSTDVSSTVTSTVTSTGIDADALRRVLDGPHHALRDEIRAVHDADWFTPRLHADDEAHRTWVREAMAQVARTPHQLLGFPAAYGGHDDVGASVAAFEMLGMGDLSLTVKAGVQWGLFGGAVQALGTKAHHDRYLRSIMDFTLPGCFAMTETGHGSDVQSLRTTAVYDPAAEEFVVHTPDESARKDYIGNAGRDGRLAVVFAQLVADGEDHGVHALLVPIRDEAGGAVPGVTITDCGPKAGLAGVDNGRIAFDQVRVPRDALLDRYAQVAPDGTYSSSIESANRRFFTMLGALVRGRISISGAGISATKVGLDVAVRYGQERRQFTDPTTGEEVRLLDHPSHQRKLLPAVARAYAFTFAQDDLKDDLQRSHVGTLGEHDVRRLETDAAAVKAGSTWNAARTLQTARESCGGSGYLASSRIPELRADTDVFTTFEGDNTVLMQLVAKNLLTAYAAGARSPLGRARTVLRSLRTRASDRVRSPLRARLLDPRAQVALLGDREDHVLDSLARRLRGAVAAGATPAAAASTVQDHMQTLGRAHVDRLLVTAFEDRVRRCEDPGTAAVLAQVRDLFVLSRVEEDLAWFLTHGRLSRADARAVTDHVDRLCAELRPHAVELVDAFGVDPAWATRSERASRQTLAA